MKMFILFLCLTISAFAQITITRDDIPTSVGTVFQFSSWYDSTEQNPRMVDVGFAGMENTWNFSADLVQGGDGYSLEIVDASQTPFFPEFSNSNLCYRLVESDTAFFYLYFLLESAGIYQIGYGIAVDTLVNTEQISPPRLELKLPLTYNVSWTKTSRDTMIGEGFLFIQEENSVNQVDAWGTITTPAGTFPCLRLRSDEQFINLTYINDILLFADTSLTVSYSWMGKDHYIFASVTLADGAATEGTTEVYDISILNNQVLDITEHPFSPEHFALYQNYPNPFNPTTDIRFVLPSSQKISLKVYNLIGEEVATLAEGILPAGEHQFRFDAAGLPGGVYFYSLTMQDRTLTKKMILLK